MKKILLVAIFMVSTISNFYGQGVSVEWGESFDAKTSVEKIIGMEDDVMYVYSKKGKKTYLQGFVGDDHSEKFSEEFILPERNGKKMNVLTMVMTSSGPIAIGYQVIKKTGKVTVVAQNFTLGGRLQGKSEVIMTTSDPVKMDEQKVFVEISRDNSKIMFGYMRQEKKEDQYHVNVVVFDNNLTVLSEREAEHDFSEAKGEDRYFSVDVHLDNDGSYLTSVEQAVYKKGVTPDYSFTIKDFAPDGELLGEKTVKFEDKGIYKPYIFFDNKENTFRVVGMYAEFKGRKDKIPGYSGVYNAVIERGSLDVIEKHLTPFSDEFLKKFHSDRKVEKASSKDKNLYVSNGFGIDHVYLTADGNLVVSAEYYTKEHKTDSRGKGYTVWIFGDIIVMSIDAEGGMNWINVVPKIQGTSMPDLPLLIVSISMPDPPILKHWSYIPGMGEDHFYLVFNDHIKNAKKAEDKQKTLVNPKKSVPYKVTIDLETGEFDKEPMVEAADEETYMAPQVIYRVKDNEYIIWTIKWKENKFGVVKFE